MCQCPLVVCGSLHANAGPNSNYLCDVPRKRAATKVYYNGHLRNGLAGCHLAACYWPFSIELTGKDNLAGAADSGR